MPAPTPLPPQIEQFLHDNPQGPMLEANIHAIGTQLARHEVRNLGILPD